MVTRTSSSFFCISGGKVAVGSSMEKSKLNCLSWPFLLFKVVFSQEPINLFLYCGSRGCGFHRHRCSGLQESDVHQDHTQEFAQIEKIRQSHF